MKQSIKANLIDYSDSDTDKSEQSPNVKTNNSLKNLTPFNTVFNEPNEYKRTKNNRDLNFTTHKPSNNAWKKLVTSDSAKNELLTLSNQEVVEDKLMSSENANELWNNSKVISIDNLKDPLWYQKFNSGEGKLKVYNNSCQLSSAFEPSRRQRQKHQINWVAMDAINREDELREKESHQKLNRRATAIKYGWL